jgi:hypothetical protein
VYTVFIANLSVYRTVQFTRGCAPGGYNDLNKLKKPTPLWLQNIILRQVCKRRFPFHSHFERVLVSVYKKLNKKFCPKIHEFKKRQFFSRIRSIKKVVKPFTQNIVFSKKVKENLSFSIFINNFGSWVFVIFGGELFSNLSIGSAQNSAFLILQLNLLNLYPIGNFEARRA